MTSNPEENIEATSPQPNQNPATGPKTPAAKASLPWWMVAIPAVAICLVLFCTVTGLAAGFWRWNTTGTDATLTDSQTGSVSVATSDEPATPVPAATTPAPVSSGDTITFSEQAATETLPAACTDASLLSSPAITQPIFSQISFGTTPGPNGWPLDSGVQFTTAITQIQATFTYMGMENGLPWERVWYFGEQELVRGSGSWAAGQAGHLSLFTQIENQNFVPGRYRLELHVAGKLAATGNFVLLDETTPTNQPVQLAYTVWNGKQHQLYLRNLDDLIRNQSLITETAPEPLLDFARYPAWSPDTVGLLYFGEAGIEQVQAEGTSGLWVFNTGLQQSYQINPETGFTSLAWSPQRSYIASAAADARLTLWHIEQNKPFNGPPGQHPTWSPDGLRLAYRGCSGAGWGIYTAQVVGSLVDETSIRQITQGDDNYPNWSPDGQRLVFTRRNGDNEDVLLVGIDGGDVAYLTTGTDVETTPVWTPEGQILYRARQDGVWGLYLMDANGSNAQRLLETPAESGWEPDAPAISSNQKLVEPTPPPPPKPRVQVPAGMGVLVVSNLKNPDEMTFTINSFEHKVGPYQYQTIPLPPGHYTWTASWPAKVSRNGIANIALGRVAYPVVER